MNFFRTIFLPEALDFITSLIKAEAIKVLYNIDRSEQYKDPKVFKKIHPEIWEFRTKFNNKQIRILAFWDSRSKHDTLVVAACGFIKKTSKIPRKEIEKVLVLKNNYFESNK